MKCKAKRHDLGFCVCSESLLILMTGGFYNLVRVELESTIYHLIFTVAISAKGVKKNYRRFVGSRIQ